MRFRTQFWPALILAVMASLGFLPQGALAHVPGAPIFSSADTTSRVVALTFDDGPSLYTPQILSILRQYQVPATFFVVGEQVQEYAQYVRDELAQGNLVGNHTFTHADMTTLPADQARFQLDSTQDAVQTAAGYTPHWFRPPYGSVNNQVSDIAASLGLRTVTWSVDPRDWSLPGTQAIISRVVGAVFPGSIVLMHDGGGDRSETVAALPSIIQNLRREGYAFETLDRLFGLAPATHCPSNPAARFAKHGYRATAQHAIYKTWLENLCEGRKLGPATSGEYDAGSSMVAQDFADTAHRIEWSRENGRTRVRIRWNMAAQAFARRGIQPAWNTPITHAWMALYLTYHGRGAALDTAYQRNHRARQDFVRGTAVVRSDGSVTWLSPRGSAP